MEQKTKKIEAILIAILFLGIFLLMSVGLGSIYLTNWDEAWYADIARNLAMGGNPLIPIWNQEPFFDKPPLYIWLEALIFKLFGVSEFAARIPSAISGIGVVVILYILTRVLFNKQTALISLLVLGSTIGFLYRARTGNLDVLLSFWLLLSILAFYKAYIDNSSRWFMFMGLVGGLAFLTKGLIAFMFPLIATAFLLVKKDFFRAKLGFLYGITPAIVISLFWIFVSYSTNGEVFMKHFFVNQTEKVAPNSMFWKYFTLDYLWFLKSGLKIWFIPFVFALPYTLYRWKKDERIILVIYFLFILGILSFSENKSNWFILPFYPIIALMISNTLYEVLRSELRFLLVGIVFLMACTQVFIYKNEYIVPNIAGDEANVALAAKKITEQGESLYLTNYYYPTTVYYSQRKVYAVYSDRKGDDPWWIKQKSDWKEILRKNNVMIITTNDELRALRESFPQYLFEELYRSGSKLLVKKV